MTEFKLKSIEDQIVEGVVDEFLFRGYYISVNDGEETVLLPTRVKHDIVKAMGSTDEDRLYVYKNSGGDIYYGWVLFIYGNGIDVISDYTTNLEHILAPINDVIYNYGM